MLYHISEEGNIPVFLPRPAPIKSGRKGNMVWAIDERHRVNYFFPRDCPRICFRPSVKSSELEKQIYGIANGDHPVLVMESDWWNALINTQLYCYHLPKRDFICVDPTAGYYIAYEPVMPLTVEVIDDLPRKILESGCELRITPDLSWLAKQIPKSSLEFSMIRMHNRSAIRKLGGY